VIVLLISENSPTARLSTVVELFVANHYIMTGIVLEVTPRGAAILSDEDSALGPRHGWIFSGSKPHIVIYIRTPETEKRWSTSTHVKSQSLNPTLFMQDLQ
jgi:hypothetical protein